MASTPYVPAYTGQYQENMVSLVNGMPYTTEDMFLTHPNGQPRLPQVQYAATTSNLYTVTQNMYGIFSYQQQQQAKVTGELRRHSPHLAYAAQRRQIGESGYHRLVRVSEPGPQPPPRTPPGCISDKQAAIGVAGGGITAAGGWGITTASGVTFESITVETSLLASSLFFFGCLIGMLGLGFVMYYTYTYINQQSNNSNCVVQNGSNAMGVTGQ